MAILESHPGLSHSDFVQALSNLAVIQMALGKLNQAESLCLRALEAEKSVAGLDRPRTGILLQALGTLYMMQHKYEQAEAVCRQASAIRERMLGLNDPVLAASQGTLEEIAAGRGDTARPRRCSDACSHVRNSAWARTISSWPGHCNTMRAFLKK